jgi:hypothetical protein
MWETVESTPSTKKKKPKTTQTKKKQNIPQTLKFKNLAFKDTTKKKNRKNIFHLCIKNLMDFYPE